MYMYMHATHTFHIRIDEESDLGVPVRLAAAAQYTQCVQCGGVQDKETGILSIHHQQSFR